MGGLEEARVLVTGASGFIGSHLVRRLLRERADVHVLARYTSTLKNPRLSDIWDQFTVHEADLRDLSSVRKAMERSSPSVLFHLGAYTHVGRSFEHAEESTQTNLRGVLNLLEASLSAREAPVFIHTSTSEVYGNAEIPFREDRKVLPVSPYSISKYAGELYCHLYRESHGFPVVILRPFNAYGPYQSCNRIIPEAIVSAVQNMDLKVTEGRQTREFNYVEDLVEGFLLAAQRKEARGEVINLGNGQEVSIRAMVDKIFASVGSRGRPLHGALPYRSREVWRMYCDDTKARTLLGWSPRVSLDEGLQRTIAWYRKEIQMGANSIYLLKSFQSS